MSTNQHNEYESSLKSIETENYLDRIFYRPIGFFIAKRLSKTGISPNAITVISIFIGSAAGPLFYYNATSGLWLGLLSLILANMLDCVDGQLARLTGKKSKIGRILDGLSGIIWFTLIYVFLALRLKNEFYTSLFFIPAVLSGISHLVQANITDYYKTLHLYFISREKGNEFQTYFEIKRQYKKMKNGFQKVLFFFYLKYTLVQENITPQLQMMLEYLRFEYGENIPEDVRLDFRRQSRRLMKTHIDRMTFNGRAVFLFLSVLSGHVWLYFLYEIVILNLILLISIRLHEKICSQFMTR